jgi:hypothetical protein
MVIVECHNNNNNKIEKRGDKGEESSPFEWRGEELIFILDWKNRLKKIINTNFLSLKIRNQFLSISFKIERTIILLRG